MKTPRSNDDGLNALTDAVLNRLWPVVSQQPAQQWDTLIADELRQDFHQGIIVSAQRGTLIPQETLTIDRFC